MINDVGAPPYLVQPRYFAKTETMQALPEV